MEWNVVLVTVDCLRYDRCGFDGYYGDTTPTLDALAPESWLFDRAYAPGTWTSESFPGILAGRHDRDLAYQGEPRFKAIPRDAPTLGTQFRDAGATTFASITNPQLTRERNFDRGFERFRNLRLERADGDEGPGRVGDGGEVLSSLQSRIAERYSANRFLARLRAQDRRVNPYAVLYLARQLSRRRGAWPTVRGGEVVDDLLEGLADVAADRFFAWTHLMDLHAPLHPETIREGDGPSDLSRQLLGDSERAGDFPSSLYSRMYDGALRYVDGQLSRIVDRLRSMGVWNETVLVVTADHGEAMHERGVNGHRVHYPYEELVHVPLLVRTPDGPGERLDVPFSLAWLHELFAELLDVPAADVPAESPSGSHLDEPEDGRLVVTDAVDPFGHTVVVQDGRWKLVRHFDGDVPSDRDQRCRLMKSVGLHDPSFGEEVFDRLNVAYHLPTDPCERSPRPVAAAPPALNERAESLRIAVDDLPETNERLDPAVTGMLEDLGYR